MMNRLHQWICSSETWARAIRGSFLPWALEAIELGDDVLEVGPGYGATTRALVDRHARGKLSALEIDPVLARRLGGVVGARVEVIEGDGAAMPFDTNRFSGVACFTMLHHVPSAALQDRLFAEVFRVLRPGGVFAGSDSLTSLGFRLLHIRDTMVIVDPATLPRRLMDAGFDDVVVEPSSRHASLRFRGRKPR